MNWMEDLERRLTALQRRDPTKREAARRAGVLVPLFVRDSMLWVVFTRRTETVEHHRGQISFPGGAEEPDDLDLSRTALRETEEELGVRPSDVRLLGKLSPMVTVTDFYVEPYVAAIPQPYVFTPAESEIAEVVEAPIGALRDPAIKETRLLPDRDEPVLFYRYGNHVIWGATARMLAELLEALE
ncbi:MAG TPA: CoA pyrophosphatase [Thermoanaerobaculia bacterium]|jgi:8-oxo-dGTP pyrophosphatase MutT (NUDIX family)|nr:CoA pyrophosphatase [Thermoanaerobaculia bacterium]